MTFMSLSIAHKMSVKEKGVYGMIKGHPLSFSDKEEEGALVRFL